MSRAFSISLVCLLLQIGVASVVAADLDIDSPLSAYEDNFIGTDSIISQEQQSESGPVTIDSGFNIVLDTPVWNNIEDGGAELSAAWGACTAMAQVVRQYFFKKRTLPAELTLREYSRVKATKETRKKSYKSVPGGKSRRKMTNDYPVSKKRPLLLWEEILFRQGGDLFKNLGRTLSFDARNGQKKYEKIRKGIESKRPPLLVFKCTQKGAVFHGLVAYRIDEYPSKSVIWVYDCNCIYVWNKDNIPRDWTMEDRLRFLAPQGYEDSPRQELSAFLGSDEGKAWQYITVSEPSSTQIIYDKSTGAFSFSSSYKELMDGQLTGSYMKTDSDMDELKLKVEK